MNAISGVLEHCRELLARDKDNTVHDAQIRGLARFIIDTFSIGFPCGFDEPRVVDTPDGQIIMMNDIELGAPEEAIGIGIALILAGLSAQEPVR